ncbi:MAG: Crp/Fnr family transcriptional regulator [Bacteroidota bacterium]
METAELLQHLDQVYRLQGEERAALEAIIRHRDYPNGAEVQAPGSRCRTVYFVESGIARIFYYRKGHDITEHFAFPGQLIVRAESLFTGEAATKGIQTLAPSRLAAIDADTLFAMYDRYHGIERLFRLLFEREHVALIRRLESLQFQTARERYRQLLQETELIRHIPLRHIATYLGITPVSLSRIRGEK